MYTKSFSCKYTLKNLTQIKFFVKDTVQSACSWTCKQKIFVTDFLAPLPQDHHIIISFYLQITRRWGFYVWLTQSNDLMLPGHQCYLLISLEKTKAVMTITFCVGLLPFPPVILNHFICSDASWSEGWEELWNSLTDMTYRNLLSQNKQIIKQWSWDNEPAKVHQRAWDCSLKLDSSSANIKVTQSFDLLFLYC